MAEFIGIETLGLVAEKVATRIYMGPAYSKPALMEKLRIKVLSGVQYKQTQILLVRKGGTTRRKIVGQTIENEAGFLKKRELVAHLSWTRCKDNKDKYVETPLGTGGAIDADYPISAAACEAILKTYAEDLADNLFFGDIRNAGTENENLSLYDGFHTNIAHDIEAGLISVANGNLIECDAIVAPADKNDSTPYDIVEDIYLRLNPKLRDQEEVLCYCDIKRGVYIANGYANRSEGHNKVKRNDDGTFVIPDMPNITFVPTDAFGVGDRLYFTIPGNFEYGVDTESEETFVGVQKGSDTDMTDIIYQIQSIQGTRVFNPFASAFAMTNGSLAPKSISGDYQNRKLIVHCNTNEGTFTVNGAAYDEPQEFAPNDVITIVATAKSGYTFVGWSNGIKTPTLSLVATGMPMSVEAMFTED